MWIHISKIAKTVIFSTQTKVETVHKLFFAKPSTIISKNTENSPNSSAYTIECKLVRNFSPIVTKIGIFSSATAIVLQTSANCSHKNSQKQQLTAHTSIVKRITVSVTNTHLSFSKHHYCSNW